MRVFTGLERLPRRLRWASSVLQHLATASSSATESEDDAATDHQSVNAATMILDSSADLMLTRRVSMEFKLNDIVLPLQSPGTSG